VDSIIVCCEHCSPHSLVLHSYAPRVSEEDLIWAELRRNLLVLGVHNARDDNACSLRQIPRAAKSCRDILFEFGRGQFWVVRPYVKENDITPVANGSQNAFQFVFEGLPRRSIHGHELFPWNIAVTQSTKPHHVAPV